MVANRLAVALAAPRSRRSWADIRVLRRQLVTMPTVGAAPVDGEPAWTWRASVCSRAPAVLRVRHEFEVRRVHAMPDSADVVTLKPRRYGPDEVLVREPMCELCTAVVAKHGVAERLQLAGPQPTRVRASNSRLEPRQCRGAHRRTASPKRSASSWSTALMGSGRSRRPRTRIAEQQAATWASRVGRTPEHCSDAVWGTAEMMEKVFSEPRMLSCSPSSVGALLRWCTAMVRDRQVPITSSRAQASCSGALASSPPACRVHSSGVDVVLGESPAPPCTRAGRGRGGWESPRPRLVRAARNHSSSSSAIATSSAALRRSLSAAERRGRPTVPPLGGVPRTTPIRPVCPGCSRGQYDSGGRRPSRDRTLPRQRQTGHQTSRRLAVTAGTLARSGRARRTTCTDHRAVCQGTAGTLRSSWVRAWAGQRRTWGNRANLGRSRGSRQACPWWSPLAALACQGCGWPRRPDHVRYA
jgi:hypothetical protein